MNYGYQKYLFSDHWRRFRKQVYKRFKKCEACESKKMLNIHHLNYKNLWQESFSDIIVLCQTYHLALHGSIKRKFSQEKWIKLHCAHVCKGKNFGKIRPKRVPKEKIPFVNKRLETPKLNLEDWKRAHNL